MSLALVTMSHTPLLDHGDPGAEVKAEVEASFSAVRDFVNEFDPEVIVNFGPDHYNGFFYELMPPFCIGYDAISIGDYGSQAGQLDVPTDIAKALAESILASDVDMAVSLRMEVDHGAVQPMEIIYGDITAKPVIPIFINSVAPPFTTLRRVRKMGDAVGNYLKTLDRRVLMIASGGLSHDPPVPRIATATPEEREALLGGGRRLTAEARHTREQRVILAAKAFTEGTSDIQDLAPEWDQNFMALLAAGDISAVDAWSPDEMTSIAGNSSHEVRTWIAGYAAMQAAGEYQVDFSYYRPIKEYIAGFGVTTVSAVK
jgi:2,3-dihydroxyphenylpropionate 1,2-dioxygenase